MDANLGLKQNVLNFSRDKLKNYCENLGLERFRADQIFRRIYTKGALSWDSMSELSQSTRAHLASQLSIQLPTVGTLQHATDGTIKWQLQVRGGAVETVYIPEVNRGTLCISSQVGCPLKCAFCATGMQGFNRNLAVSEIVGQVLYAAHQLGQFKVQSDGRKPITNVVFMGMGEPLLNTRAVIETLRILLDDLGFGLSKRRVTVSTSGVAPGIMELAEANIDVALALSLHAPTDLLRSKLMPINQTYSIETVLKSVKAYLKNSSANRSGVTIEYVMLKQINDTPEHAQALLACLKGLPAKINLIPWNSVESLPFEPSLDGAIELFAQRLKSAGRIVLIRKNRGHEIAAACGQLAGQVQSRLTKRLG